MQLRIRNKTGQFIAIVLLALSVQSLTAQVKKDGSLKAWYPISGNAFDASGNNNHPVFNNAQLTKDRFGNPNGAYHFNGSSSYIRIPNNATLNFNSTITLSVWVRPTGFYYDICHASVVLSKGGGNYLPGNYAIRYDESLYTEGQGCSGDRLTDSIHHNFRGTGTALQPYTPYINKNQWYHVVYINDGANASLYVDCELKYSIPFPEYFINNEDLFIGKSDDAIFPFWLNGDVDDIRIYDRPLNKEEVLSLCQDRPLEKPEKKDSVVTSEPLVKDTIKEAPIEKRDNKLSRIITVDHDSISVTLYDNGEIDGDSITLIYNDKILAQHQRLTDKPITFFIKIKPGDTRNELVMYAENLGSIPPNTALMVIYDGEKRYELNISSTKDSNGMVAFRLRE